MMVCLCVCPYVRSSTCSLHVVAGCVSRTCEHATSALPCVTRLHAHAAACATTSHLSGLALLPLPAPLSAVFLNCVNSGKMLPVLMGVCCVPPVVRPRRRFQRQRHRGGGTAHDAVHGWVRDGHADETSVAQPANPRGFLKDWHGSDKMETWWLASDQLALLTWCRVRWLWRLRLRW